jgi:DNA-binding transcriptional MerR regulator
MKIGELAKRSGLSPSAIRFYESKGLLQSVGRQGNGYREYPPEAVAVLAIISNAQQTGFTLDEIQRMLPHDLRHWDHEALVEGLTRKIADIEAMEQRLAHNKAQLIGLLERVKKDPNDLPCVDKAEQIVASLVAASVAGEVR